jgi:quercetin dioxygenase-like cupin family protein
LQPAPASRRWPTITGEKHWHGAGPTIAMTHLAIQEALDGKTVDWMEKVSDA